jgi:hypothetical protein
MSDLLVGCKVKYSKNSKEHEGIVLKVDRSQGGYKMAWVLMEDGSVEESYATSLTIDPDDVKFIYAMNKDYKLRRKILTERTERFEILDL